MALELSGMAPLLLVRDFAASLSFYRDVLGFSLVARSDAAYGPGWALLQRARAELMLNGMRDASADPPALSEDRRRGHADTALYFGCAQLDAAFEHLRGHGLEVRPPAMTGYGFRSLELRDPDGYTIVLHWPETPEARLDWERRYGIHFDEAGGEPLASFP